MAVTCPSVLVVPHHVYACFYTSYCGTAFFFFSDCLIDCDTNPDKWFLVFLRRSFRGKVTGDRHGAARSRSEHDPCSFHMALFFLDRGKMLSAELRPISGVYPSMNTRAVGLGIFLQSRLNGF